MTDKGGLRTFLHLLDEREQLVFVKRFLDEIERTLFHGFHRHWHIAVRRDEHDRQRRLALNEFVLQFQAAHAIHPDINKKAGHFPRIVTSQECFG